MAIEQGDLDSCRDQYDALIFQKGTILSAGLTSVDRVLGLLSTTTGNLDQAMAHFEDALTFCRKAGYRPELAWTCCDYSDTLLQRGGERDRAKALTMLEESLAISTELGMLPLMERVAGRLDEAQSQPGRAEAYPNSLTQREVEVLGLVAAGRSNADIAEELVISPNTVVRHVSNIYDKIGAANRVEAASYAAQHGLLG